MQDFLFTVSPKLLLKQQNKPNQTTTTQKHFCGEKYFLEMPGIPILCLCEDETTASAAERVPNQTESSPEQHHSHGDTLK